MLSAEAREGVVAQLDSGRQSRLSRLFTRIQRPSVDAIGGDVREELVDELVPLLTEMDREPKPAASLEG